MRIRHTWLAIALLAHAPALAQEGTEQAAPALTPALTRSSLGNPVSDPELARITGKFILANGAELALTITSDTVVNGQAVLRSVLTLDRAASLQVYGRDAAGHGDSYQPNVSAQGGPVPTGVSIAIDRTSGMQTITRTYTPVQPATSVTVGGNTQEAGALGLVALPVAVGTPAVATPDGTVSLASVRGGTEVLLAGDQFIAAHILGSSVANALVNSGNDRTFDTATTVSIDLRNALPYQLGSAAMRVDALALDATRGMLR